MTKIAALTPYLYARALIAVAVAVLLVAVQGSVSAHAQMANPTDSLSGLQNRVSQLEHRLKQLQRDFDTGGGTLRAAPSTSGFPSAGTQLPETFAARAEIRMGELEEELTRLTGQVEELSFSVSSLTTRLDKLVEDIDFRLTALERTRRQPATGAAPGGQTGFTATPMPPAQTLPGGPPVQFGQPSRVGAPPQNEQPPVAGQLPGTGLPKSLGTISPSDLAVGATQDGPAPGMPAPQGPGVEQTTLPQTPETAVARILPAGTPKEQYDFAYKLVRQGDYAQAEGAFREFGELHPQDPLAGNARYWLGETYYVRQDFVQAADVFIGVVTGYPNSPKRPHSMLKLGMSLLAMGQKAEGCATLSELLDGNTEGADATRMRAEAERDSAGCT